MNEGVLFLRSRRLMKISKVMVSVVIPRRRRQLQKLLLRLG
jgi:hypothetical protein